MVDKIVFCKTTDKWGEFSNFAPIGFKEWDSDLKEETYWPTMEHYYQAHKFYKSPFSYYQFIRDFINQEANPWRAANIGRSKEYEIALRKDWDTEKQTVMYQGLYMKFTQNSIARDLLVIDSGDLEIEEYSSKDLYWGRNNQGFGFNYLGELLMKLRKELRG